MPTLSVFVYRTLIDPLLAGLRHSIKEQIPEGSSCLDLACGTGTLVFELARGCSSVVGIDMDEAKIKAAQNRVEIKGLSHLSFKMMDASDLSAFEDKHFDYATMAMAVHQFPPELRIEIIREAKRVSKKLIIADYAVPLPKTISGEFAKFIEFLAGKEHNGNFKNYYKNGGMQTQFEEMGIKAEKIAKRGLGVFQIWVCN
ncbi:MAG: class I SAM-dependent methyltransferase [Bacteroidetes bacterium]|jgi:ubiquinone/menaquinone biosynthesis C-methylase UbiE|nr:class I SAM-dependent methyltransferase [Bacteroidota bacterium]MBT3751353.1 class I SAM-dependent methyltransferase [Bacteroidota bacterium]MBT4398103.1 class I SAM-dependent methyltransferase [Bacteroidota bacterium]MBT4409819.1 class I SAM-dependent methyltransferase [Bacteroidota bacterium]MBT7092466.1 class I SAM-dependent methyltransferase [Bacteroidota bacterium]